MDLETRKWVEEVTHRKAPLMEVGEGSFGIARVPTALVYEWNRVTGVVRLVEVPDPSFHLELYMPNAHTVDGMKVRDNYGNEWECQVTVRRGVRAYHLRRQVA
jgi:hypothetical protein